MGVWPKSVKKKCPTVPLQIVFKNDVVSPFSTFGSTFWPLQELPKNFLEMHKTKIFRKINFWPQYGWTTIRQSDERVSREYLQLALHELKHKLKMCSTREKRFGWSICADDNTTHSEKHRTNVVINLPLLNLTVHRIRSNSTIICSSK